MAIDCNNFREHNHNFPSSNRCKSMEDRNITNLPTEILHEVAISVHGKDLISFSLTCQRFRDLCHHIRYVSFQNSWNVSTADFSSFVSTSLNPEMITKCNISNCYWVPGKLIQTFLLKCINLNSLLVSGTRLSSALLVPILSKCEKISELSFNLEPGSLWKDMDDQYPLRVFKRNTSVLPLVRSSSFTFSKCRTVLGNLVKLEITLNDMIPEILAILSFCDSVEELRVVFSRKKNDYESVLLLETGIYGLPPIHSRPQLTSLVLLNVRNQDRYEELYSGIPLGNSADSSQLLTHWNDIRPYPSVQKRADEMESQASSTSNSSIIRSIRDRTFMQQNVMADKVRVVDCIYCNEMFAEFCMSHPKVKALKLRAPTGSTEDNPYKSCDPEIVTLPELQALCVEPSLIYEDPKSNAAVSCRGEKSLLRQFLHSCTGLRELEILSLSSSSSPIEADLSFITQCRALKKLTLADFHVIDGQFIEQIFENCTELESVRLKDLGSKGLCCYTNSLCTALPKASKLKHFSLSQKNVVPLWKLLDSLEKCGSLVYLGLIVPSFADPLKLKAEAFVRRFQHLVDSCSQLVALFCALNITKSHCDKATKSLTQQTTPTRSAFQVEFQVIPSGSYSKVDVDSRLLAPVHQQLLTHFNSRVANLPHRCRPSLFVS